MKCGIPRKAPTLVQWLVAGRFVLLAAMSLIAETATAQSIRIEAQNMALRAAMVELARAQSIDIVFSERQVEGKWVHCSYEGQVLEEAFACLLEPLALTAQRVRRRQYVLLSRTESAVRPLRGFVRGAEEGEVLHGAHVYLPVLRVGAVTNRGGYFALPSLPVEAIVTRISYVGYMHVDTTLVPGSAPVHIALSRNSSPAAELVVEAERLRTPPGAVHVPVKTLSRLPSFPGEPDLMQTLQWLPGVRKVGSGFPGLIVRGGQPDQNLYLLDGAPVYHPWHAFSLISLFQPEAFKQIRLYQGSFPAEYGGRLSAVLDAELRDGTSGESNAVAAIGLLSGRVLIAQPIGSGVAAMVSGRRSYLDRIVGSVHPVEENGVRDTLRTGYYFHDLSAKVTWQSSPRRRLSVSGYRGGDVFDIRLPFDLSPNVRSWLKPSPLFFEIDSKWTTTLVSARYQYLYRDEVYLAATGYVSRYHAVEHIFLRPTASGAVDSEYYVGLNDVGIKLDIDYFPSLIHQVRTGLRVIVRSFSSRLKAVVQRSPSSLDVMSGESFARPVELVLYAQDTWHLHPSVEIQSGLRIASLRGGSFVAATPRIGAKVTFGRWAIQANGGRQIQYLHRIRDRHSLLYDLVSTRWVSAGSSAKPSTSINLSLGVQRQWRNQIVISAETYLHRARSVLLPRDVSEYKDGLEGPGVQVAALLGQYGRGRARAFGMEFLFRRQVGAWTTWAAYALGRSETRLFGVRYVPADYDVTHDLHASVSREIGPWQVSMSSVWRTGLPVTVPVGRYAIKGVLDSEPTNFLYMPSINNGRLPPYLRMDVRAGYEFAWGTSRIRATVQMHNVTNRRNVINRTFDPSVEGPVVARDRRGLPFVPLAEIRIIF